MNRMKKLFQNKKKDILSIYFTAGYPKLQDTAVLLKWLQKAGADMVEIGMPFSDPLADGPVIQASSQTALQNGMSLKVLFDQLKNCREEIHIPIVLMGYLNPVLQFGIEAFLKQCKLAGVDGLILPDLPIDEYEQDYKDLFEQAGLDNILLVTPETSDERLKQIDTLSKGFIYAVSSSSTTGTEKDWSKTEAYFKRLYDSRLKNPVLVGFGIKDRASFITASQYTNGAIIGTAFIRQLQKEGDMKDNIKQFIEGVISERSASGNLKSIS